MFWKHWRKSDFKHKGEHFHRQKTHTLPIYIHKNKKCQTLIFLLNKEWANYKDYFLLKDFIRFPPPSPVSSAEEVRPFVDNDSVSDHVGGTFICHTWCSVHSCIVSLSSQWWVHQWTTKQNKVSFIIISILLEGKLRLRAARVHSWDTYSGQLYGPPKLSQLHHTALQSPKPKPTSQEKCCKKLWWFGHTK